MMLWQLFTSYFSLSLLPLYSRIHLPQLVFSLKRKGKHQSLRVNILSNADPIVLAQEYKRRSHFFLFYLHLTSATRNDRRGDMHGRQILKGNHVHDVHASHERTRWVVFGKVDCNRVSVQSVDLAVMLLTRRDQFWGGLFCCYP